MNQGTDRTTWTVAPQTIYKYETHDKHGFPKHQRYQARIAQTLHNEWVKLGGEALEFWDVPKKVRASKRKRLNKLARYKQRAETGV